MKSIITTVTIIIAALLLITSCFGGKKADERGYIVKVGEKVPNFELNFTDGTTKSIKSFRGKYVMLQFTASWCSVCRQEMPYIESEIWQKFKENPKFELFGIDLKESAEQTIDFAQQIPVTYPITLDPDGKIFELFCDPKAGVTRNIIINPEGEIILLTRLFEMEEFNSMVELLEKSLSE
mgnify:FL=1